MRYPLSGNSTNNLFWPSVIVTLVGAHSILLGLTIYLFTEFFYNVFFATSIENFFFVRQSGIFLFLIGLFYLYPLFNLKSFYNLILLTVISKTVAVLFLISNAQLTTAPAMIYLAAFFDGLMGAVLAVVYLQCKKAYLQMNSNIIQTEEASVKEVSW
jgi:hypothetical protein